MIVAKERSAGSYRLSAYYLATTLSMFPLVLIHPSLFIILVFPITGLMGVGNFFGIWFVLLLQYFTTQVCRREAGKGWGRGREGVGEGQRRGGGGEKGWGRSREGVGEGERKGGVAGKEVGEEWGSGREWVGEGRRRYGQEWVYAWIPLLYSWLKYVLCMWSLLTRFMNSLTLFFLL